MIPKTIHYCWFGHGKKSELIQRCIASWRHHCPNWKIIEWNEDNFDVNTIPYMAEAYKEKKWAFVSDVARLVILSQEGGVYLDTDVELTAPINSWVENDAFYVFESERYINSGMGFGCIKGHPSVNAMLNWYVGKHFSKQIPCPAGNTDALISYYKQIVRDGCTQQIGSLLLLSHSDYRQKATHHYAATWTDSPPVDRITRYSTLKRILRNHKIFSWIEKHLGKSIMKLYTFLVYDLWEYGLSHFVKRLFRYRKK